MARKLRIAVLKRMENPEIVRAYWKPAFAERYAGPCAHFEEGQEFTLTHWDGPPEGFCTWAWADIHKEIMLMLGGGSHPAFKSPNVAIACCSDGMKPVVFKIERIEA